jgi:hypothetical protein
MSDLPIVLGGAMPENYGANKPPDHVDVRAGLQLHSQNLDRFATALKTTQARAAVEAATQALASTHATMGKMVAAADELAVQRPEDRVLNPGRQGSPPMISYVTPEAKKNEVRIALATAYNREAARLDKAATENTVAQAGLEQQIANRLRNPRANETSVAHVADSIRNHVKNLGSESAASAFVHNAIVAGDHETVAAVLSAPPFVSGLNREMHAHLRDMAEQKFSPDEYADRQTLRKLGEHMTMASSLFLGRTNEMLPKPNLAAAENARALKALKDGV